MTTTPDSPTLAPPAQPPAAVPPAAVPPGPRRTSSRVVSTIAICAGAVLVLGTVATGILAIVRTASVHSDTTTVSAAGATMLDLDVSAAEVTVGYGAVSEATLHVTGTGAGDWRLERDGDRLVVTSDRDWWGRWGWFRDPDSVELTLPSSAAGLDADLDIDSGSLRADGDFGGLTLTLDAGSLRVSGTAGTLAADVSAGSAHVDLSGVDDARLSVSAGSVEGRLAGAAPSTMTIDVSAGRVDLDVPDAEYALTSDVSAGGFTHQLSTDPASDHRIDVRVSAGAVVLRPVD